MASETWEILYCHDLKGRIHPQQRGKSRQYLRGFNKVNSGSVDDVIFEFIRYNNDSIMFRSEKASNRFQSHMSCSSVLRCLRFTHWNIWNSGGVRTLIALHHGRKTKSESFTSCRGRVNISGGSKIARINMDFLRKLKSVGRPARLLLFLREKFVVRRQLRRFRKNRNCSLAQESIHLAAVTLSRWLCE